MSGERSPLPKFSSPPVVETVVGVFFEPLPAFDVAQRSLFWSGLRTEFPTVEERPPIDELRDQVDGDVLVSSHHIRWQLTEVPPSPRLWAKSHDGRHTIQIQQDALLLNWERREDDPTPYWPYEQRRQDLASKLALLDMFLGDAEIGSVRPTSCFARYINHIEYGETEAFSSVLQRVLTTWTNEIIDGWLPPVEQCNLYLTFPLPEKQGRLHVTVMPAVHRQSKKRLLRMDFTARGVPREPTTAAAIDWVDVGHEWIVRGFTSLTRPAMHIQWRRTQ